MASARWQFFIDVGGTFTDVVARRPDGRLLTHKLLSSGVVRGTVGAESTLDCIIDPRRIGDPQEFWAGYELTLRDPNDGGLRHPQQTSARAGTPFNDDADTWNGHVARFDSPTGRLFLDGQPFAGPGGRPPWCEQTRQNEWAYELRGPEEAPILAIRYLMGLRLDDAIGPIEVRLGTTRATNALLERRGARVALVTTRGFADVLKIGYQDRPKLFDLNIKKRDELAEQVIEIDERLDAFGSVLQPPDLPTIRQQLRAVKASGIDALAICLLHAHVNSDHESFVAAVAEEIGFSNVAVSSRVVSLERIVPRGDTTIVDAYLTPVIQNYVRSMRRSTPEARMQLMTSAGGLIDAAMVCGKDTLLSGPAGGVVGCAQVAADAGIDKTIGFDMGGTSTDVSRIDETVAPDGGARRFEYQHETVKADVRIVTPMLAVETVAAGGGSICMFDGQKLTVGPASAGADPGPACYGNGGPLTVTDMNVMLGRVVPEHFPFRLDRKTVESQLHTLGDELRRVTRSALSPIELAEGFVQIANANMASAIKRISMAKGYDVREYALTTFGGAGAQHACAIAGLLGIRRILCSPFAGVLSAVGIGAAHVQRIGERSVREPLDHGVAAKLQPVFNEIHDDLLGALVSQGVDPTDVIAPVRTMDLCYAGQASLISVSADPIEEAAGQFVAMHRQRYGYVHEDRPINVHVVRVELRAPSRHIDTRYLQPTDQALPGARATRLVIDGKARQVPLYLRPELCAGQRITGPGIIVDETSTIVIDPQWEARVSDTGNVEMHDTRAAGKPGMRVATRETVSSAVDPVQLELFNNRFASIAEQMGTVLRRTALSVNVKERLDYSCAIFAPSGDLVANAPHIPVHLGGMSHCVRALIQDVNAFRPGDVYVTNDPYAGGSHLNDVTVITPVHDETGRHILFFAASRAHHAEIGGTRPGSMPPDSKSLAQEGVVIRAFPWIEQGKVQYDRMRALLTASPYPSRAPEENLADIAAQVAANQTGVRELRSMVERYSVEVVHAYMRHIQDAAGKKMRAALRRLGNGIYEFSDRLDDGTPIRLTLTVRDDEATLDFSGSGPVHAGNLNANAAIVTSATLYCLRCLIDEEIPLNAGVMEPIEMILPTCFLNPPRHDDPDRCAAVVGGNVETSQRIVDCIFGALGTVAAGQGTMNNLLMGNDRFGYYETICGGAGAGPGFAGADAVHTHMTNTRMTDPEVLEARVPVRLLRFCVRAGSGGVGRYRGGCGVIRELEFLEPLDVSIISQRRTTAPYGLCGGGAGRPGRNLLIRAGTNVEELLEPITSFAARAGDRLIIETPGGGGWGEETPERSAGER